MIQLGEDPTRVILAGGLGVDAIKRIPLLGKHEVEASLGFEFAEKSLLITFHPVTLEPEESIKQMTALLDVLSELHDVQLIFTAPNADVGGRAISDVINAFVAENDKAHLRISLGQLVYLSCMQFVDGVVGNSSSGLLEAPTLGLELLILVIVKKVGLPRVASLIALLQKKIFVQPLKLSMPRITKMLWRILTILMVMVVPAKRLLIHSQA